MKKEHRCTKCRVLLAVEKNSKLFIRYKKLQFIVTGGSVQVVCRCCQTLQEIETGNAHGQDCEFSQRLTQ